MAPPPKPPGQRRRRNKDQPQWRQLPAEGPSGPPPALPKRKRAWLKKTREEWAALWASPMATLWQRADHSALHRWAHLADLFYRGELPPSLFSELRYLEERFYLSPEARKRAFLEVAPPGGSPAPEEEQEPAQPQARSRVKLRAV